MSLDLHIDYYLSKSDIDYINQFVYEKLKISVVSPQMHKLNVHATTLIFNCVNFTKLPHLTCEYLIFIDHTIKDCIDYSKTICIDSNMNAWIHEHYDINNILLFSVIGYKDDANAVFAKSPQLLGCRHNKKIVLNKYHIHYELLKTISYTCGQELVAKYLAIRPNSTKSARFI